jgi:hypothetical protein
MKILMSITSLGKFRSTLDKFMTYLKQGSSTEQRKEIDKYEMKISTGMRIDPRGSVNLFVECVIPYADHILSGNDSFFLGSDLEVDTEYKTLHNQLQKWWPAFSEEQREQCRKFMKLLVMQGAIAVKHEELRQIINQHRDPSNPLIF